MVDYFGRPVVFKALDLKALMFHSGLLLVGHSDAMLLRMQCPLLGHAEEYANRWAGDDTRALLHITSVSLHWVRQRMKHGLNGWMAGKATSASSANHPVQIQSRLWRIFPLCPRKAQ